MSKVGWRSLHSQPQKIVSVLYKGGQAAREEPRLLGCVGILCFLQENRDVYFVQKMSSD